MMEKKTPQTCINNQDLESKFFDSELDVDPFVKKTFPVKWIEENNFATYVCIICHEIARDPPSIDCGHFYCKTCLQESKIKNGLKCPFCKEKLSDPSENTHLSKMMSRFSVMCFYKDRGCLIKPVFGLNGQMLSKHAEGCSYRIICCELCSQYVWMKNKQKHDLKECEKRRRSCVACSEYISHTEWKEHVILLDTPLEPQKCVNLIPCPQKCKSKENGLMLEGFILKKNLQHHLTECPETEIICAYCSEKVRLGHEKTHLLQDKNAKKHLPNMIDQLKQLEKNVEESKCQLQSNAKKRKAFAIESDRELEEKYTKYLNDATRIYAKDARGEWGEAVIAEIFPLNNVRIRFTNFSAEYDLVINTANEEHLLAFDKDSIPPLVNEERKNDIKISGFSEGEEVWAASRYNGAGGIELMQGTVLKSKRGQLLIEASPSWQRKNSRHKNACRWYHMMEVHRMSTWKSTEAPNLPPEVPEVENRTVTRQDLLRLLPLISNLAGVVSVEIDTSPS